MANAELDVTMPRLDSRDDYIDYLESESEGADPTGARLRRNLVKSYVLETVRDSRSMPNAAETFAATAGLQVHSIDSGDLYRLHNAAGEVVALMEGVDSRFPVLHSTIRTNPLDQMVKAAVTSSPWLDHVWLPGRFFDALWKWTKATADPGRLAKLKFSYTGHYEQLNELSPSDPGERALPEGEIDDFEGDIVEDNDDILEVRHSQFEVADRVGVLDMRLTQMRSIYDPLQSTVRIKIPSGGRGGHEVYDYGKVTNRSVSFAEQQKIVRLVIDLYGRVTEAVEDKLWYSTGEGCAGGVGFSGRPVYLLFEEPLDLRTLHTWADRTFGSKRNRFRLGGHTYVVGHKSFAATRIWC